MTVIHPGKIIHDLEGILRRTVRSGWKDHGVLGGETIYAHEKDAANMASFLACKHLAPKEARRVPVLMGVHDHHEALISDFTPAMGFSPEEKKDLTRDAIDVIRLIPHRGPFLYDALMEFEEGTTPAALFGQGIDRLQMAKEALRIEQGNRCAYNMGPYFAYAGIKLANSPLHETFLAIEKKRPSRAKDKPVLKRQPLSPEARKAVLAQARQNIETLRRKLTVRDFNA